MLRFVMDRARVPEQVERAALSLDDPEEGPFLIVTRDGKFVTCLAKGMKPGSWPIITRGQFDAIAAKVGDLRERMHAAKKLAGNGGVRALLRRIYDAADELSREDFIAISALQPLYAKDFFQLYISGACDLEDARDILLPMLRKTDKLKPVYEESLHSYWQTLWAMGNFIVLACMDGTEGISEELLDLMGDSKPLSWPATRQGIVPVALRGVWAVARMGKPLLTPYKRRYRESLSRLQNLDTASCILAIGARHSRLRAEAEKALGIEISAEIQGTPDGTIAEAIRTIALKFAELDRVLPRALLEMHRGFGARMSMILKSRVSSPLFQFERIEDVPEETALLLATHSDWNYLEKAKGNADAILWFFAMIPWVARAAPEELFFPREILRVLHTPWKPEQTLGVLRAMRDHVGRPRPATPAGPARKGPCPCGSGKKYKRCCGENEKDTET
jgi:hypothetical protein